MEGRTAHFRKPSPDGAIDLEWPTVLHSFTPRVTAVQQVQQVTLLAQDPMTNQAINVSASSPNQIAQIGLDRATVASAFGGATAHIASEPVKSQSEGQAVAQALLDLLANAYVAAEGVTDGDPRIRAGAKVTISGVGERFSGTYRVASATHVLRGGSTYETRFANSPTHTLLGAVGGGRGNGSRHVRLATRDRHRDQQLRPPQPRTSTCQLSGARLGSRGGMGAGRDAERRERARGADAPGRGRGGPHRVRARRYHSAVRARLAVQRPGHTGRRPPCTARTARSW